VSWQDDFEEDWTTGDDEETAVASCPNCHADVYEDADSCPSCGEFLTGATGSLDAKPKWFVALGLLGILAVVLVLSGLMQLL